MTIRRLLSASDANVFLSAEITGNTGTLAQPHGLGASPSVFFAMLQGIGASDPNLSATADATNVYVDAASTDVKYIILAWQ